MPVFKIQYLSFNFKTEHQIQEALIILEKSDCSLHDLLNSANEIIDSSLYFIFYMENTENPCYYFFNQKTSKWMKTQYKCPYCDAPISLAEIKSVMSELNHLDNDVLEEIYDFMPQIDNSNLPQYSHYNHEFKTKILNLCKSCYQTVYHAVMD